MLKAKLVVKQGQKVMGLYREDRQTAHPRGIFFKSILGYFCSLCSLVLIINMIQTPSKDRCEKVFLYFYCCPDFSFCKYCTTLELPGYQSGSGYSGEIRKKDVSFTRRKDLENFQYRTGRKPCRPQKSAR